MISQRNMSEGSIYKGILAFALPIFLGNLFQQLYNTADSLIVGNMIGSNALAAVSSSGNLIFLMIGFFSGISNGAGVVIGQYFGAKNIEKMKDAIHTTIAMGLIAAIILTIFATWAAPILLELMDTPLNVMDESTTYFKIFFLGSIGMVMYNIFVGILQALGDSKHPLYYLIISSIINVILDIVLIMFVHRGVASAAFATIISQAISAILCFRLLLKMEGDAKVHISKISIKLDVAKRILKVGIPSGVQNSIIAIANVVVQSNVNHFGEMAMAGCGAYSKIEGFAFLPITSFTMALTTFVSQNIGAQKYDRVKKGARFGILCAMGLAEVVGIIMYLFSPILIQMFNDQSEVIAFGVSRAKTCGLFFCLLAYTHSISAILRGAGRAVIPMFVMLICWCAVRVSILWIFVPIFENIAVVNWVYPITWILSSIVFCWYYYRVDWCYR